MATILIENISKTFENTVTPKKDTKDRSLFNVVPTDLFFEDKNASKRKRKRITIDFSQKMIQIHKELRLKNKLFQSFAFKRRLGLESWSFGSKQSIVCPESQEIQNGFIPHKLEETVQKKSTKCVQGTYKNEVFVKALREIYLEIPKGAITALVGGSGSGKSTLLRVIAGLEKPDKGSIWLNGKNTSGMSIQERGIGFVSQSYALFPHMTVLENIAFGLRVKKELPFQIQAKCQYLLKLIQLSNLSSSYPNQLSGGQKQRVALARALAPDPQFLLLDEPFAALDMRMRKELREWIYTLQKQSLVTIVLVTHDYKEALEIATNIVMLKNGHVEQLGDPVDFYDYFLQKKLL